MQLSYGISKAALDKLTVSLATDFAHRKIPIRVNAIHPGMFPSEVNKIDGPMVTVLPGLIAPIPAGRTGT